MTFHRFVDALRDVVWPSITPFTPEQIRTQETARNTQLAAEASLLVDLRRRESKQIEAAHDQVLELVEEEKGRGASVSSRLTSILGMTSVSAAISLAVLTAVVGGGLSTAPRWLAIVVAGLAFYSLAQLCCSLLAALRGLSRRSSYSLTPLDVLPEKGETWDTYRVRHIKELLEVLRDQDESNNRKVSCMAVAHVGLRNFLCAMLVESMLFCAALAIPSKVEKEPESQNAQEGAEPQSPVPSAVDGASGAENHP